MTEEKEPINVDLPRWARTQAESTNGFLESMSKKLDGLNIDPEPFLRRLEAIVKALEENVKKQEEQRQEQEKINTSIKEQTSVLARIAYAMEKRNELEELQQKKEEEKQNTSSQQSNLKDSIQGGKIDSQETTKKKADPNITVDKSWHIHSGDWELWMDKNRGYHIEDGSTIRYPNERRSVYMRNTKDGSFFEIVPTSTEDGWFRKVKDVREVGENSYKYTPSSKEYEILGISDIKFLDKTQLRILRGLMAESEKDYYTYENNSAQSAEEIIAKRGLNRANFGIDSKGHVSEFQPIPDNTIFR